MVDVFSYAVALTGSIATGKSSVATIFKELDFTIIDADTISHAILDEEHVKISELFGSHLVSNKQVDRKILGSIVFSNTDKRKVLENLLHPLIYNRIVLLSKELDKKKSPYFVDIPLFFEHKRYKIEKSLVVYTPKHIQLDRLIKREKYSEEVALRRIATQIDINEKVKQADYVIDNSGTLMQLQEECIRVKVEIEKDFK